MFCAGEMGILVSRCVPPVLFTGNPVGKEVVFSNEPSEEVHFHNRINFLTDKSRVGYRIINRDFNLIITCVIKSSKLAIIQFDRNFSSRIGGNLYECSSSNDDSSKQN